MSKTIYIGGRLESKEKGNVVTGANAILDDTKGKKQNVINKETDDELARLEQSKQDNLNFDNAPTEDSTNPVTSGGVYTAEKALSDAIEAILLLIPSAATVLNKLVDTNTMNSSISTATATFRGTYNAVSDLGLTYQATHAQIEAALDALGLTADNNDFVFVQIPISDQSQDIAKTERFKFNGTNWLYEYDLNTSGFTATQWAAINSGITVALVTKLTDLPTAAALQLALNAKQDTLTFDTEPTALSQNPVTSGGIYTAIQAVATALSDYSTTTDGRLNILEGLIPTEASSSNKLTDKAYVDGLIQAITELIPAEASTTNQLADKAYVLAQILAATPAFKGQFTTLAELQAVASPKAGDLGIVRTKDSDGMDVFTVYQYLSNAWNVFYSLSYHPQTKPATTGTTGDYPYNGMGRVELAKNMVNTGTELAPVMVNQLTQDMFYKGAVGSRVPNTNTIFVIRYDYVLGEDITVPANCVLEFDGGSINSSNFTLIDLNNAQLLGTPKIIGCDISNPYEKLLKFSWIGINNTDAQYNTTLLNLIAKKHIDWYIDTDCVINDVITITQLINISGHSSAYARLSCITASSSAGLLFTSVNRHTHSFIENFRIVAKYNAIEFTGYAYDTYIQNVNVESEDGDCIVFADNFQVHIADCWLKAPNGCGVYGLKGTTCSVRRVSINMCKVAYHNCMCVWYDCNGVFGDCTEHWFLWDKLQNEYGIDITLINCNIEDVIKEAFYTPNNEYDYIFNFTFINSSIYVYKRDENDNKDDSGLIRYCPISVKGIDKIINFALSNNSDAWADGIYPIETYRSIGTSGNNMVQYVSRFTAKVGNTINDTTNISYKVNGDRPSNPILGYSMFDYGKKRQIIYSQVDGTNRWVTGEGYSPALLFGDTASRPTNDLDFKDIGYKYFDNTLHIPIFLRNAGGTKYWIDARGNTPNKRVGPTADRPTVSQLKFETWFSDAGFEYFDTDLGKPIYAKEKSGANVVWVDATGTPV